METQPPRNIPRLRDVDLLQRLVGGCGQLACSPFRCKLRGNSLPINVMQVAALLQRQHNRLEQLGVWHLVVLHKSNISNNRHRSILCVLQCRNVQHDLYSCPSSSLTSSSLFSSCSSPCPASACGIIPIGGIPGTRSVVVCSGTQPCTQPTWYGGPPRWHHCWVGKHHLRGVHPRHGRSHEHLWSAWHHARLRKVHAWCTTCSSVMGPCVYIPCVGKVNLPCAHQSAYHGRTSV